MSNPNPPEQAAVASRWSVWFAQIALAGYGAFLAANTSPYAAGADSSGYLNSARLLAAGRLAAEFARFRALAQTAGRPIYALLFDVEEHAALQERCPGGWTQIGKVKNITFWRLTGTEPHQEEK